VKRQVITHLMALVIGALLVYGKTQTTTSNKQQDKKDNSVVTEVHTVKPDGSSVVRRRIRKDVVQQTVTAVRQDTRPGLQVNLASDKVRVGLIVSTQLVGVPGLIYGGSVQRKLIGPLNMGVFGLTNATFGVIIGLDL